MAKTLTIGKLELSLAEVNGAGAIVDGKGHVRAVFSRKGGWVTFDDPDKWEAALDLVSVRVMKDGSEPEKPPPARKVVRRSGKRKERSAEPSP